MVLEYGNWSFVIRPLSVVPKSMLHTGFLKSTPAHFAASLMPAVASSPSISFATISTPLLPMGGSTLATAPSKKTLSSWENFLRRGGLRLSLFMAGVMFLGGTPAMIQPSARARMNEPTSSGLSKPATTPVERTTKFRSWEIVSPAAL